MSHIRNGRPRAPVASAGDVRPGSAPPNPSTGASGLRPSVQAPQDRSPSDPAAGSGSGGGAMRASHEFLLEVMHELRNPITTIHGWVSRLQADGEDPALRQRGLRSIRRSAEALSRMTEDLVDFSLMAEQRLELVLAPTDLTALIDVAVDAVTTAADAKRITLARELDPRLGTVRCDAQRIEQVLRNLLSNALKFTPDGGTITVLARRSREEIAIEVADTGIGMDPTFVPAAFDRFSQASPPRPRAGLGLGLAITRGIVELHGGSIAGTSEGPGKGSVFTVRLPALSCSAPTGPAR